MLCCDTSLRAHPLPTHDSPTLRSMGIVRSLAEVQNLCPFTRPVKAGCAF